MSYFMLSVSVVEMQQTDATEPPEQGKTSSWRRH